MTSLERQEHISYSKTDEPYRKLMRANGQSQASFRPSCGLQEQISDANPDKTYIERLRAEDQRQPNCFASPINTPLDNTFDTQNMMYEAVWKLRRKVEEDRANEVISASRENIFYKPAAVESNSSFTQSQAANLHQGLAKIEQPTISDDRRPTSVRRASAA
jgi:hypothetical protein